MGKIIGKIVGNIIGILFNFGILYFSAKYLFKVPVDNFTLTVYAIIFTALSNIRYAQKEQR